MMGGKKDDAAEEKRRRHVKRIERLMRVPKVFEPSFRNPDPDGEEASFNETDRRWAVFYEKCTPYDVEDYDTCVAYCKDLIKANDGYVDDYYCDSDRDGSDDDESTPSSSASSASDDDE
jgi:hypothetical protein